MMRKKLLHRITIENNGFTLIELSIVLIVVGFLTSFSIRALNQYNTYQNIKQTQNDLQVIEKYLAYFVDTHGFLPCPANPFDLPSDDSYLRSMNCKDISIQKKKPTKTLFFKNKQDKQIIYGKIPTRTLNLPDIYSIDKWRGFYTYSVTHALTDENKYIETAGAIEVKDAHGNSLLNPKASAQYVILSHGINGISYIDTCDNKIAHANEYENCNKDDLFIKTPISLGTQKFDDLVVYKKIILSDGYQKNCNVYNFLNSYGVKASYEVPENIRVNDTLRICDDKLRRKLKLKEGCTAFRCMQSGVFRQSEYVIY